MKKISFLVWDFLSLNIPLKLIITKSEDLTWWGDPIIVPVGDLLPSFFRRNWKVSWIWIWFVPKWFPSFPVILVFSKIFCPLYFSKQIKSELGVTEMLYLSIKIIVCYIHQQLLPTTLFHENIFFSGNELLVSWKVSKNISNKII